jgi:hypothetical protein
LLAGLEIQALDRTAPLLPMRRGQIERRTHDDPRHGATSLFAALDARTGKVIGQTQQRHRSGEFRNFLDTIEKNVPAELNVHLILDNYGNHKTPDDPQLAGQAAALPSALHADFGLMAQPRATLVRRPHRKATTARGSLLHERTRTSHRNLHPAPQQRPLRLA